MLFQKTLLKLWYASLSEPFRVLLNSSILRKRKPLWSSWNQMILPSLQKWVTFLFFISINLIQTIYSWFILYLWERERESKRVRDWERIKFSKRMLYIIIDLFLVKFSGITFDKSIFFTELLRITSTSIPALICQILLFIS